MAGLNLDKLVGTTTSKGTKITQALADSVAADNDNIEIIQDNTEQVLREMDAAFAKALEKIGIRAEGDVVGYMTEHFIVDTGRLRNSITHAVYSDDDSVYVGTNVEYGLYVHEGTHGREGRHFLTDPLSANLKVYRDVLKDELEKNS